MARGSAAAKFADGTQHLVGASSSGGDDKLPVSLFLPSGSVSNPALSRRHSGNSRSPVPVSGLFIFQPYCNLPEPDLSFPGEFPTEKHHPRLGGGPPRGHFSNNSSKHDPPTPHALPCSFHSSTGFDTRVNSSSQRCPCVNMKPIPFLPQNFLQTGVPRASHNP